jgi:hypothetical protein
MKIKSITIYLFLFPTLFILSCLTPQEAFDKGYYRKAFISSSEQIKKGKNIESNSFIIKKSAKALIEKELKRDENLLNSIKVKDWVKVQDRYYRLLEKLGKVNIETDGEILDEYDELCSLKKDLDFKIVDYYYERGFKYLEQHYKNGSKKLARDAYYQFLKANESGGYLYYHDLGDLISESRKRGVVYYICYDRNLGNSIFFKRLPKNADFEPDCIVNIEHDGINSKQEISESSQFYTDEVFVKKEEVKDTSGNITYRSIYKEITATVITSEIEVTLSTTTWVDVENVTGQCSKYSESFTSSVSDFYEEIRIVGDKEAGRASISESIGEPTFFRNNLDCDLWRKVENDL